MGVRKTENFYRRFPKKALRGMLDLTLEEIGVYNILLDVMYDTWRPLPFETKGEKAWVVGWVPGAPQKVNPIIRSLLAKGRIREVEIDGRRYLTDDQFEAEYRAVKGEREPPKSGGEVGAKSRKVAEKSEEVGEKSPLLDPQNEENQKVARPEKSKRRLRKEKQEKEKSPSSPRPQWRGDPALRRRVADDQRYGERFAASYVDTAEPSADGGIIARTHIGFDKLTACSALAGVRVHAPP